MTPYFHSSKTSPASRSFHVTALAIAACCLSATGAPAGTHEPPLVKSLSRNAWSVSLESAQTFNIDNNPNRYFFLTQMLSLDWEPFDPLRIGSLRVRHQFRSTFFASAIFNGPESVYLGWGPQVRGLFSLGESRWSLFLGGGAGLGWADANTADRFDKGLGQQFTFILLASSGIHYQISPRWAVWSGILWHHLSNANLSEPAKENVGPDELGVITGVSLSF